MRNLWLSLLLLLCTLQNFAQSSKQTDSLIALSEKSTDDRLKLKLYGDLSWQFSTINFNKAQEYGTLALKLAEKLKDSTSIALAYSDLGNANLRVNNLKEALNYHLKALTLREQLGLKAQAAGSISNISIIYKQLGNFKDALVYMHKALKIYEDSKEEAKQAVVLANIGNVYLSYEKLEEAKETFERAIILGEKTNQLSVLALANSGIFNYLYKQNKFKESLGYAFRAQDYLKRLNQKSELASVSNNLGKVYHHLKDYSKALNYFNSSLKTRMEMKDKIGMGSCYKNLAETYLVLNEYEKATYYLDESIKIFKSEGAKEYLRDALFILAKANENQKNYGEALNLYKGSAALKDSIYSHEARAKINELEIAYQTEKKAQRIVQLNQENSIQKLKITNRNMVLTALGALLFVGIILVYLIFKSYKLKQEAKANEALLAQQQQATINVLVAEENERKRIANDLHDGLGQLFSAVKLNLSALSHKTNFSSDFDKSSYLNTIALVDDSCQELRSLSHQMSSNSLNHLGLIQALNDFIQKLDSRELKINFIASGMDIRLGVNVEVIIYRIIQEAINNVIKHAGANKLDIQLSRDKEILDLMIEDNGKGFDVNSEKFKEGLGLNNIRSRVEYLKGSIDISSEPGIGTLIAIHIPL